MRSNGLLKWLMIPVAVLVLFVAIRLFSGGSTSAPPTADAGAKLTPAEMKALGIEGQTGTLEAGKMADVVVWNGNPFSSYALAEQVFIDGRRLYDRSAPAATPRSDFQLGQEVH